MNQELASLQCHKEETALPVIREKARWLKQNAPYLKDLFFVVCAAAQRVGLF